MEPFRGLLFFQRPTDKLNGRLWVVATEPDADDRVIILSIQSRWGDPGDDQACVLEGNEHPSLHGSRSLFIAYRHAKPISCANFEQFCADGVFEERQPFLNV